MCVYMCVCVCVCVRERERERETIVRSKEVPWTRYFKGLGNFE